MDAAFAVAAGLAVVDQLVRAALMALIIFFVFWLGLAFCVGMIAKSRSFAFWPYSFLSLLASPILALVTVWFFWLTDSFSWIFFLSLLAGPMIALATLRMAIKLSKDNVRKAQEDNTG